MIRKEYVIILRQNKKYNLWEAEFTAEDAAEVIEAFGVNTLPTPFTLAMEGENVKQYIQARNPDKIIRLEI